MKRRDFLKKGTSLASLAVAGSLGFSKKASAGAHAKQINVLTVGDPWDMALQNSLKIFEEKTGIKVNLESLGYPALQARLVNSFLTKTSDADVIAVDQMWISHIGQWMDSVLTISYRRTRHGPQRFLTKFCTHYQHGEEIFGLSLCSHGQGLCTEQTYLTE